MRHSLSINGNVTSRLILLAVVSSPGIVNAQWRDLKSDEDVVFFPTLAHSIHDGQAWVMDIHGWVYESKVSESRTSALEKALDPDLKTIDPAEDKNFRERTGRFVLDHERGKRISIQLGAKTFDLKRSDGIGHFQDQITVNADGVAGLQKAAGDVKGQLTYQMVMAKKDSRIFTGTVYLLPERGLSVITDIDDTIRVAGIPDKKAMFKSTFLKPFEAVPGMADLYAAWVKERSATIHYVSPSPWQLYPTLAEFLHNSNFPAGSFHLRAVELKDRALINVLTSPVEFKRITIEAILKRFPRRQFALVGNAIEKDPEIYAGLARDYTAQVKYIFIRDVTGASEDDARYKEAFQGLTITQCRVFREPDEIKSAIRNSEPANPLLEPFGEPDK